MTNGEPRLISVDTDINACSGKYDAIVYSFQASSDRSQSGWPKSHFSGRREQFGVPAEIALLTQAGAREARERS